MDIFLHIKMGKPSTHLILPRSGCLHSSPGPFDCHLEDETGSPGFSQRVNIKVSSLISY